MKKILLIFIFYSSVMFSQNITNNLASNGVFYIRDATYSYFTLSQNGGRVGIGPNITSPRAQLEIGGTDGLLVTGTANTGTVRALGSGVRMHWYPRKGAFRAGMAETTWWDDDGSTSPKLALYSLAIGYQPRASGVASTALGAYNKSTGDYALSLGSYCLASGSHSIAIGTQVYASGIYSIAMGAGADTNGRDGSMVFGDDTYFQTAYASADNQLTMRFSGGYRLWSSYPDSTAGVYMRHGQSGWSNYSDRNKKENFETLDGEWVLSRLRNVPVTKWNYKKTDPAVKYAGPMAQDFYAAFQLNGTDSLGINSISIDGINMAGIKALDKRTMEMKAEIDGLKKQNAQLAAENRNLRDKISAIDTVEKELSEIRTLKQELKDQLNLVKNKNSEEEKVSVVTGGKK